MDKDEGARGVEGEEVSWQDVVRRTDAAKFARGQRVREILGEEQEESCEKIESIEVS